MHTNYVYKPNHLIFDAKYTLDSENVRIFTQKRLESFRFFLGFCIWISYESEKGSERARKMKE